ncbi:MAG: ABC transporter permease, partial [Opitutales bacterium]
MKLPWHFYLALKQLFPTGRWVSFFSVLAIVGVALGVNVMIVVVAFMKGFQAQFRDDVLDSYGEIRVMARVGQDDWREDMRRIEAIPGVKAATPFMQGFVFLDYYGDGRVPLVSGIDVESVENALPLTKYIRKASVARRFAGFAAPHPSLDDLDDETVFLSVTMGDRMGAHPPLVSLDRRSLSQNAGNGQLEIARVSPHVRGDVWKLTFEDAGSFRVVGQFHGPEEQPFRLGEGPFEFLDGMVSFDLHAGQVAFREGDAFVFEIIESSTVEVYAPIMLQRAKKEEVMPPRELRVAGFFEAPWRQFGEDSMICSLRLLQELNGEEGVVHGFNVRLQPGMAESEERVNEVAARLEREFADTEEGWILAETGKYRPGMDMELGFGDAIAPSWKGQTVKVMQVERLEALDQVRFEGILHARY